MNIQPPRRDNKKQGNIKQPADVESISIANLGQKIDIDPKELSEACAQAAKQAYLMGETNDEESYKEEMEEMLEEILYEKAGKKPLLEKPIK